jgi:hypothetical protein
MLSDSEEKRLRRVIAQRKRTLSFLSQFRCAVCGRRVTIVDGGVAIVCLHLADDFTLRKGFVVEVWDDGRQIYRKSRGG